MSQGLRGHSIGRSSLLVWSPGTWALPSRPDSGSERVLAALGQEGAWTPVMKDQPKKNQASDSTGAQQEEGLGVQLGPCREGGPSPRPTQRTAPYPGAGRTLNRAQTLTGPDPEGGGKGPAPRVFSLLQLRRGRGPRAQGRTPPATARFQRAAGSRASVDRGM